MIQTLLLPPKVDVEENPSTGRATIIWYESQLRPTTSFRVILTLEAPAWHRTGVRPFAFDYVALDTAAHLRVAVTRQVTVSQKVGPPGREWGVRVGWRNPLTPQATPQIHLYRCQDDGLLSDPDEPLDWHSIIGQPQVVEPEPAKVMYSLDPVDTARDYYRRLEDKRVQATPLENGVRFQHGGGAKVTVTLEEPGRPAAFCYDVRPDEWMETVRPDGTLDLDAASTVIRIVHTGRVKVEVIAHEDNRDALVVETCERRDVPEIPFQGVALRPRDFPQLRFRRRRIDRLIPSQRQPWVIALFEIGISFVPVVGLVYDLGQLAYAATTGKTFFGYDVSEEELVVMGVATLIGIGSTAGAKKMMSKVVRGTAVQAAADAAVLKEITRVVDTGFVEAVGQLPGRQWDDLVRALDRHLARKLPLQGLVEKLGDVVNETYLKSIERQLVNKVFKADFSGFRDADLAAAYTQYVQGAKGAAADPAAWAKRQRSGRPIQHLKRVMGDDYVEVINRAQRAEILPLRLTRKHIEAYDVLVGKGVADYGTLRALRLSKQYKGLRLGRFFEIDHLLERRFWRNNPKIASAFDEYGSGMAYVVPKDAAVAREMLVKFGGQHIAYVHKLKTSMLKRYIPHGAESLMTVQEIWDAHVHVLRSLGLEQSAIQRRLARDFQLMADEMGEKFRGRMPSAADMRYPLWPRFARDPDTEAWIRL